MTATITPSAKMPHLTRANPEIRLQDYYQALKFYLEIPSHYIDRIVFLENSDTDLDRFRQLASNYPNKQVEFISVSSNYAVERGKGYGEFRMLDQGLEQCSSIAPDDVFWKVTGRLKVSNLQQLIETSPKNYLLYCDMRNVPIIGEKLGGNQWMELRVFSCTLSAYDRFLRGEYHKVTDSSVSIEKVLFQTFKSKLKDDLIVPRFTRQPIVEGYSGFGDVSYQSTSYKLKNLLRQVTRAATPWLWL